MTLVPDFDFGLWNAWIIMVAFLAASFIPLMVAGEKTDARMEGEPPLREAGGATFPATIVTHAVLMPFTLVYSFFVPLDEGWWLITGLVVSAVAIVMALAASVTFATAPLGEPMTHGVYAISRHPMYVAGFLVYAGMGLAGTSWIFLVCAVVEILAYRSMVPEEERAMIAKYGAAYEEYVERTPRWIGLPKAQDRVVTS